MTTYAGEALKELLAARPPVRYTDDTQIPIQIKYLGSGVGLVGVTTTTRDVRFYYGNSVSTYTIDASIGVNGVLDVSSTTYNTLAKCVARINASKRWRAMKVDMLDAQVPSVTLKALTRTTGFQQAAGKGLYAETGRNQSITIAIKAHRDCSQIKNLTTDVSKLTDANLNALNKLFRLNAVTQHSSGSANIRLYDGQDAAVASPVWQVKSTSTSALQEVNFTEGMWATRGKPMVVVMQVYGSSAGAARMLQVNGRTSF